MSLPRILAGGPARETSSLVYQLHRQGLEAQAGEWFEMHFRHEIVPDPGGARWQHSKIERVAKMREEFLDAGRVCSCAWAGTPPDVYHDTHCFGRCDALLMVDTDVILGPGVLERMWAVDADVVYGVYWTYSDWGGSMADWPQVWGVHPYGWVQEMADALRAPGVNEVEVYGGGACTLIRGRGFESHYWPLLESQRHLPNMSAGEDRTYCLGLETRGIKQVAVTNLPIHHCYALQDQTKPALKRIREKVGLMEVAI
jgi:hypothetical protein